MTPLLSTITRLHIGDGWSSAGATSGATGRTV